MLGYVLPLSLSCPASERMISLIELNHLYLQDSMQPSSS